MIADDLRWSHMIYMPRAIPWFPDESVESTLHVSTLAWNGFNALPSFCCVYVTDLTFVGLRLRFVDVCVTYVQWSCVDLQMCPRVVGIPFQMGASHHLLLCGGENLPMDAFESTRRQHQQKAPECKGNSRVCVSLVELDEFLFQSP